MDQPAPSPSYRDSLLRNQSDICLTISNPMDIATGHVTPPVTVPTPDHEKATYGPWMMLDRRQRWSPRTTIPTVSTSMDVTVSGSRFNPIFEEEILEQPHNSEANIVDPVVPPIA
ncbi:hypothetical protein V6N13_046997 [Hibiscus sabdariffa]